MARHRRPLLRFATVLTGQAWLADDVVSDAQPPLATDQMVSIALSPRWS